MVTSLRALAVGNANGKDEIFGSARFEQSTYLPKNGARPCTRERNGHAMTQAAIRRLLFALGQGRVNHAMQIFRVDFHRSGHVRKQCLFAILQHTVGGHHANQVLQ